jgi:hypothetical protein
VARLVDDDVAIYALDVFRKSPEERANEEAMQQSSID